MFFLGRDSPSAKGINERNEKKTSLQGARRPEEPSGCPKRQNEAAEEARRGKMGPEEAKWGCRGGPKRQNGAPKEARGRPEGAQMGPRSKKRAAGGALAIGLKEKKSFLRWRSGPGL